MREIYEESIEEAGKKYVARLVKLDNALLVFFDEETDFLLGTLAFGMPDLGGMHHLSSVLLGEENAYIARLLAERLSAYTKGMVLVSIHIASELDSTVVKHLVNIAEKIVGEAMHSK
jgi:hypothetical protein